MARRLAYRGTMPIPSLPDLAPLLLSAALVLVLMGAAVQVAVGAGLSVVAGPFLLLWLGPAAGVPVLLCLNLLISLVATAFGGRDLRWADVAAASGATLVGCALACACPALPDSVLKALTAAVLVVVAWPRSPPAAASSATAVAGGVAAAGLLTGALTVWTATPGPILPVALARVGRSGAEIRRAMQPISSVGYGAGLAWIARSRTALPWAGLPSGDAVGSGAFAALIGATLLGTGLGFLLRPRVDARLVVRLVRVIAAVAALLLIVSLLR